HPMVEILTVHLAESIRATEQGLEEAIPLYEEAIRLKERRGERPTALYRLRTNLVSVHWELGRHDVVDTLQRDLLERVEADDPNQWFNWFVHLTRGEFLLQRGRPEEAEVHLLRARELARRHADVREVDRHRAIDALRRLYTATGRADALERLAAEEE